MYVTISQPRYLPHISYIARIVHSDYFVILDDVQYDEKAQQNRNRYLNYHNGKSQWLTIPIDKSITSKPIIKDMEIKDVWFYKKHIETLKNNYKKCKYYDEELLNKCIDVTHKMFLFYAVEHIEIIMNYLGFDMPKIKYSSSINTFGTSKQDKLEKLLGSFNDKNLFFITGKGSMSYLKDMPFRFGYNSNTYEYKSANNEYVPYMNILDTIFNIGTEETRKMILDIQYEDRIL